MLIVRDILDTEKLVRSRLLYRTAIETIPLANALGRILADDLTARENVPAFNRSSVDGYAVLAADTFGCSESMPSMLRFAGEVHMGQPAGLPLNPGECIYVPTGGALPAGADAMVMIEDVDHYGDDFRYIRKASPPGAHVVFTGDDVPEGRTILPAGTIIQPQSIGVLASLGYNQVKVAVRPKVAILSTGDELVPVEQQELKPGQVRDINGPMLSAAVTRAGGMPLGGQIIADQADLLREAIREALGSADLVLISGGSSVGVQDQVAVILDQLGAPGVLQHGIAMKPGKPTIIAQIDGKPVFGLPGHPMAALFVFDLLVHPLILGMQGIRLTEPIKIPARLATNMPSNHGRESLIPVRLDPHPTQSTDSPDGYRTAVPIYSKSGLISLLSQSHGYIRIPRECEGLPAGTIVEVCLYR